MALKANGVYFRSVVTVAIYFCNSPLQAKSTALHNRERRRQIGSFTYLSLWNSSNASSHAAG